MKHLEVIENRVKNKINNEIVIKSKDKSRVYEIFIKIKCI
jgi:hypothetical protein